jgi:plastocyanin
VANAEARANDIVKMLFAVYFGCMVMLGQATHATAATVEIKLMQTPAGKTYFDPAGVHIAPGDTVRWVQIGGFHSVTAYHPSNDNHELRIPVSAKPWDSDILLANYPKRGATFEHVFTVPGVYDYFCKPHEMAGMVGRIVVGDAGDGPADKAVRLRARRTLEVSSRDSAQRISPGRRDSAERNSAGSMR